MSNLIQTSSGIRPASVRVYRPDLSDVGMCVAWNDVVNGNAVADIKAAGMGWVRIDVLWGYIESKQGVRNWSDTDTAINKIVAAGLKPLIILQTCPTWLTGASVVTCGPTTDAMRAAWASWCTDVATRYKGKVGAWEVWNEANLAMFWGDSSTNVAPNATDFVKLMAVSYPALKAVDVSVPVISAGIGGAGGSTADIEINTWTPATLAAGLSAWCDGIGVHHYTPTGDTWALDRVQVAMDKYGINKPIWTTECGCPTSTSTSTWQNSTFSCTEAGQADIIATLIPALRAKSHGGVACLYQYADRNTASDTDKESHFGTMVHSDGSVKPGKPAAVAQGQASAWRAVTVEVKV